MTHPVYHYTTLPDVRLIAAAGAQTLELDIRYGDDVEIVEPAVGP